MSSADSTALTKGDILFCDNYAPVIGVGDYLINVSEQLNPTTTPPIDECYSASQVFSVRGPRYSLPPEDVFSVFPPDEALGYFWQFLPNIVFSKRDLPWERSAEIFGTDATTPWLALVSFVDGEGTLLAPADGSTNRTNVMSISAATLYAAAGDDILWPQNLAADWYETPQSLATTQCNVIDITPQAFLDLIPTFADLPFLAHARKVKPTAKDASVLKVTGSGWYSVVVGNRLPNPSTATAAGARNIVHLVSLEGFQDYIPGAANAKSIPSSIARVRMISLQSWTFTCMPTGAAGESFAELVSGLVTEVTNTPQGTSFVLPVQAITGATAAETYAYDATQNGYVPLRYQTRLGEQTFAWYRGPFSPIPVANFVDTLQDGADDPAGWQPFDSASAALIYDKNWGLFDVSYGVAWETGRLLALSNANFGQQLLSWRRNGQQLIDIILERMSQISTLNSFKGNDPNPVTEQELLQQIQPYAITDGFTKALLTQLLDQIQPALSEPGLTLPDAPPPPYPALPSPVKDPQTIQDMLTDTNIQLAIRSVGASGLESITDFLAQMYLLEGVPFENLVPNGELLPAESLRFFYLDPNWLAALVEGALSIGIESSLDQIYQDLMKDLIWDTALGAVQNARDKMLGTLADTTPPNSTIEFEQESMTGMLLRSALVSGWPGLEVNAYAQYTTVDGAVQPVLSSFIGLLRMERLSNDLLLCVWPAIPAIVTIDEPHEGITFGFEDPNYTLFLRSVDTSNYGMPMCTDAEMDGTCSYSIVATPGSGFLGENLVLTLSGSDGLVSSIESTLQLTGGQTLAVHDFAVQMIKVPEQAIFAAQNSQL